MPAGDPRTCRHPCAWCERPDRWPDACAEGPDAPDPRCAPVIERHCADGDHRRCATGACTVAARWHQEVRDAGVRAAHITGTLWAVVSTLGDTLDVVAIENDLGRARLRLAGALWRAGRHPTPDGLGLVYIVRATDGGFL